MKPSAHLLIATDDAADLQPTLRALASELASAQAVALDLQATIGKVIAALGDTPCEAIFELQNADHLAQTLGDLSTFVGAIARSVPETWHVEAHEAARALHLRDLAVRLSARGGTGTLHVVEAEDDDFWLDVG